MPVRLIGVGHYLPARLVTNHDLAQQVDTSDEWIVQRTGIRQRHIAAAGEYTSDLATAAARQALAQAGVAPAAVDLIIVATTTPDRTFPSTATLVQHKLGVAGAAAFDVQAVCSGFIYALAVANAMLLQGTARTALVIGAETLSRLLNWHDRTTCVLFGDGAGAVVLRREDGTRGILSTHLHADGSKHGILQVDGGPSLTQTTGHITMQGQEVFKQAVGLMADVLQEALTANNLTTADIDWLVPHQANQRIIEATAKKLGLPLERTVMTIGLHANTSAASIPLALAHAAAQFKPQQLIALEALGGGLTWGAALLRW